MRAYVILLVFTVIMFMQYGFNLLLKVAALEFDADFLKDLIFSIISGAILYIAFIDEYKDKK